MPRTFLFLSTCCLLDNTSGAAISVRNFMEALAAAGHHCKTFTATHFDPRREVPLRQFLGPEGASDAAIGKLLRVDFHDVEHSIFRTASTQGRNFTDDEAKKMARIWRQELPRANPDLVITYGSSDYTQSLQNFARKKGIPIVFYLGNAEYSRSDCFHEMDTIVTPSHFLKDHYKETYNLDARVVRTIMNRPRIVPELDISIANRPEMRRLGFVTFFTAAAEKGLTLFARLALTAQKRIPGMRFLVVEGRADRSVLQEAGLDIGALSNVWWLPSQRMVREVYRQTAIQLVPSFWKEGFPRTVMEGQLNGLPILASRRGGIPEALNGGGFLFDPPPQCLEKFTRLPSEEDIEPWMETLERLWKDDAFYIDSVVRARAAAAPFHPDVTEPASVAFFDNLVEERRATAGQRRLAG